MRTSGLWPWTDHLDTPPSCEQEPLSTVKPVAVTDEIMASLRNTNGGLEFEWGSAEPARGSGAT
jgi:hypothetical protein